MPLATCNGIELCYETSGTRSDPTILLVMGLGAQLIAWTQQWCRGLTDAGFHVVRFDNRDAGLSSKLEDQIVDLPAIMSAWAGQGTMPAVPYLLDDMADDAAALLDHLDVPRAHIVGVSLGGMIAQSIAIRHRHRVRSLTSIMSTTGEPEFYETEPAVRARLFGPPAASREEAIANSVATSQLLSAAKWFDRARAAASAAAAYDRSYYPQGVLRQTAAIRASGSRDAALRLLDLPTLVIHGRQDRLILPSGGIHTADVIPGADLLLVQHMGHDLPLPLTGFLTSTIAAHACTADETDAAG
jgi:pimeloyl-ACP methyl ester carboxylesterase